MQLTKQITALVISMSLIATEPVVAAVYAPAILTSHPATEENPRVQALLQRLETIKGMDRSLLSGSEKKELRNEVKGIRKEMKKIGKGVYLSVGAIIIIVLLLILLL